VRFAPGGNEILLWRTPDWRVHDTVFDRPIDELDATGVPRSPTQAMLDDYRVRHESAPVGGTRTAVLTYLSLALVLVGLGVLIAGPAPVIGTRRHWFWIGGIPFGVGGLHWLSRERPWTDPPPPPVDPKTGRQIRRTGLTGFLVMLASGFVASILVGLLGNAVVPGALP